MPSRKGLGPLTHEYTPFFFDVGPPCIRDHLEPPAGLDDGPIAVAQMAKLVQREPKTIHNLKSKSRTTELPFPSSVAPGLWQYSEVRPFLMKCFPGSAHRLPRSYTEAMNLLREESLRSP